VRLALSVLLLLCSITPGLAQVSPDQARAGSHSEIERALPGSHPSSYYIYASRLFGEGREEEAVLWFYVGQLRYRFHLTAHPDLPGDGDPALMASLNATIGQTINEWAGGDPGLWVAQIEKALEWDSATENTYTSRQDFQSQWTQTRADLEGLIAWISDNQVLILEEREAAGLPNR
jgi:hypothetical protein